MGVRFKGNSEVSLGQGIEQGLILQCRLSINSWPGFYAHFQPPLQKHPLILPPITPPRTQHRQDRVLIPMYMQRRNRKNGVIPGREMAEVPVQEQRRGHPFCTVPYQGDFLFGAKVWATSFMLKMPAVGELAVETCLGSTGVESPSRVCLACFV